MKKQEDAPLEDPLGKAWKLQTQVPFWKRLAAFAFGQNFVTRAEHSACAVTVPTKAVVPYKASPICQPLVQLGSTVVEVVEIVDVETVDVETVDVEAVDVLCVLVLVTTCGTRSCSPRRQEDPPSTLAFKSKLATPPPWDRQ